LLRHITAITGDSDTAADVLQETLMTICRKLGSLRDPRWFRAWAYRIATRQARRRMKDASRWVSLDDQGSESALLEESDVSTIDAEFLEQSIGELSAASQVVIRMHYLDDLTIAEISEALELAPGTVKSRLSYGLSLLRSKLERSKI
jgi:RNA polymerase sigma-70 factor (ECF subfamily)